jgi:S-adenosylmethionine decarboxylase
MEEVKPKPVYSRCKQFNFAGTHVLLEFWGAINLGSLEIIEAALIKAVEACGATLLDIKLHHFGPFQGVSGVALIKESHLSIHTWPEFEYAALDIFVCGEVNPYKAVPVLKQVFKPKKVQVIDLKRGIFE